MTHVRTVLGPVSPAELTGIMHHEHLLSLTPGPWLSGGRRRDEQDHHVAHDEDQVQHAVAALSGLPALGINTVVDLSPYGVVGRDDDGDNVALLQEISRRSGLHVVAGTSVYLESYSPQWAREADLRTMTARFVADVTDGIGTGRVPAGIFGEQATGLNEITTHEEKCFRAAARAHRDTGLAMTTHTTHGTMALEQIEILRQEKADLNRVVIGHMDTRPDLDYVREVLATGVNIAFDTIGKQNWDFFLAPPPAVRRDGEYTKNAYHQSDTTRARWLMQLLRDGFEDQILLAQDLTGAEVYLNPDTHGQWGYSYLASAFKTLLLELGTEPAHLHKLLHANPVRLLAS